MSAGLARELESLIDEMRRLATGANIHRAKGACARAQLDLQGYRDRALTEEGLIDMVKAMRTEIAKMRRGSRP